MAISDPPSITAVSPVNEVKVIGAEGVPLKWITTFSRYTPARSTRISPGWVCSTAY
jgi:hypothetical protein